jgi:hypothetical protein
LPTLPTDDPFDWELFDEQPLSVRKVTWEFNVFPDKLVEPKDAARAALLMIEYWETKVGDGTP